VKIRGKALRIKLIVINSYTWTMLPRQTGDPASIDGGTEVGICYEGDLFSYYYYVQFLGHVQFNVHVMNQPLPQAL
jgi:hypothetical protein